MPRLARIAIPGVPHHVTQRGNNRQDIFFADDDRHLYLALLKTHALEHGLALLGYCLMTNHVHLVVLPGQPDALARALRRAHGQFARWVGRVGRGR